MEFGRIFMDVLQIFAEVNQISTKSKLIPLIAILTIFVNSFIYLLITISTKPLLTDLTKQSLLIITTSPTTPEFFNILIALKQDVKILFGVEAVFVLLNLTTSLLLSIVTVLASAFTYGEKYISIVKVLKETIKSFKRPLITGFYVTLFVTGYIFLFLMTLLPIVYVVDGPVWLSSAILYLCMLLALVFLTYLSVIWTLAFVLSVLEEKYGMEALGKAAKILKGMKLKGFVLNLVFTILAVVLFEVMVNLAMSKQSTWVQVSLGLISVVFSSLVRMIQLIAFTVLYHKCKKILGEVQLHGSKDYAKVASMPLINENIP
jgi:hypothetical protein